MTKRNIKYNIPFDNIYWSKVYFILNNQQYLWSVILTHVKNLPPSWMLKLKWDIHMTASPGKLRDFCWCKFFRLFFRLEQELLAKVVSQLECRTSDPTLMEMADQAVLSSIEIEGDSTTWIGKKKVFT